MIPQRKTNSYESKCRGKTCEHEDRTVRAGEGVTVPGRPKDFGDGVWWDVYHIECAPDPDRGLSDWDDFAASDYQLALKTAWLDTPTNLIVDAVAGSGKTTSIAWLLATTWSDMAAYLGRPPRVLFSCFNRHVRETMQARTVRSLPAGTQIQTLNSVGHRVLVRFLQDKTGLAPQELDGRKAWRFCRTLYPCKPTDLENEGGFGTVPAPNDLEGWRRVFAFLMPGEPVPQDFTLDALVDECLRIMERNKALLVPLRKLVDLRRVTLSADHQHLCTHFEVSLEPIEGLAAPEVLFAAVERVLWSMNRAAYELGVIDYNDQLWLPHCWDLQPPVYDAVFVDEAQDVNEAQLSLLSKCGGQRGRFVFVGDPHQAMYGFRGAGVGIMDRIQELLAGTPRGVVRLPLSVCYRCPVEVVRAVQAKGHVTDIEVAPNAPAGVVQDLSTLDDWWEGIEPGSMVLCRTNAPLLEAYFQLLRAGIRTSLRGFGEKVHDDIEGLINSCETDKKTSIAELLQRAEGHTYALVKKHLDAERDETATMANDTFDLLKILAEEQVTVSGVRKRAKDLLKHSAQGDDCVVLSTVHKAKGLEAPDVYVLRPDLMPFPFAVGWQAHQELNIEYVCMTRAMRSLNWVRKPVRFVDWF